jgi:ClpP class serine protease
MRLLDAAASVPWAIRPEALQVILDIAAREDVAPAVIAGVMHGHSAPEAVAARDGKPLDKTFAAEVRDGVAVVHAKGPIFRYAGLFDDVSGATSVQNLARDFTAALENPNVSSILLHVDSPGGEVSGIAEFADMVHAARDTKPVWAYVSDLGASAGYWIASAASRIVVAQTAALGSIGVVMAVRDPRATKSKEIEFVSSQSPNKRPDPTTQGGQDQYQALVDATADVFVGAVARNRGVEAQTVLEDFGAGGLLIGQAAVDAGLADAVGSYEGALAEMQARTSRAEKAAQRKQDRAAEHPSAPITASAGPTPGGRPMGMRERFFAWLDGMDVEASANDTEQEGRPMAEQHTDTGRQPAPIQPPPQAAATDDGELKRLRAEVEAQRSTIVRLRDERIATEALGFADATVRDEKARPAEREAIVAAYTRAALDDATLNDGADRVGTVKALYGVRPQGTLTREELHPAALQILTQREATVRDKDAPADAARLEDLLSKTALGSAVLTERNGRN